MDGMVGKPTIYWLSVEAGEKLSGLNGNGEDTFLSPAERARLAGMRFSRRSADWLLGRRAAKTLLRRSFPELAGVHDSEITIAGEPSGAPFVMFTGSSAGNRGSLSLSHRRRTALAAFCPTPGWKIGIDLEVVEPRPDNFLQDFFTAVEVETALVYPLEERMVWVTLAWSAKEAVLKALGTGLRVDTRKVEIGRPSKIECGGLSCWRPLAVRSALFEDGGCWLWWRRQGEFVMTLAALPVPVQCQCQDEVHLLDLTQVS